MEALLGAAVRFKHRPKVLSATRNALGAITADHAENSAYVMRIMTPKQTKILGSQKLPFGTDPTDYFSQAASEFESEKGTKLRDELRAEFGSVNQGTKFFFLGDVVEKKLDERERTKHAEACSSCGKTAAEVGLNRLLRCSACTIAPLYCCAECQRGAWGVHKAECKAKRKASK
jgi:hypothetical protein